MHASIAVIINLLLTLVRILRPGGWKKIVAENLMLKHQLTIMTRSHKNAPNLLRSDRIFLGFLSMLIPRQRLEAVAVQPSTLLRFHRALVERKYQVLYGNRSGKRPGAQGPSQELIRAIVESKKRKPRFGCPRIAQIITTKFGTEIKTGPFTPISHPFVERLIGTVRREFLDPTPCWNSLDLQRKLGEFKDYYNNHRTHTALAGRSPASSPPATAAAPAKIAK